MCTKIEILLFSTILGIYWDMCRYQVTYESSIVGNLVVPPLLGVFWNMCQYRKFSYFFLLLGGYVNALIWGMFFFPANYRECTDKWQYRETSCLLPPLEVPWKYTPLSCFSIIITFYDLFQLCHLRVKVCHKRQTFSIGGELFAIKRDMVAVRGGYGCPKIRICAMKGKFVPWKANMSHKRWKCAVEGDLGHERRIHGRQLWSSIEYVGNMGTISFY